MRKSTHDQCMDMLRVMPSSAAQDAKWDDLKKLYSIALLRLQDGDAKMAVEWSALNEKWRPSPARLLEIAAEQASPVPDAETVYAEIVRQVQTEGLYARPHPDRPSIKLEGPPPFSHPIVEKIVHYCGGWPMVCNGESNYAEGLKKQVRGAHESVSADWRENVKAQLMLPAEQRNMRFFPKWKSFALPAEWTPDYQLPAIEPQRFEEPSVSDLPAAIRSQIAAIAAKRMLPPPPPPGRIPGKSRISRTNDLTPEDRARIAEELRNHNATDETKADPQAVTEAA